MRTDRPDSAALADDAADLVAAYVHIPFCRRICPYCDFAVQVGGDIEGYVEALCAEIAAAEPFGRALDAVYFGGGTPTTLDPALLGRVLDTVATSLGIADGAEISIEANPEDCTEDVLRGVRDLGFNRISLGVQSLDAATLDALGRAHDAEGARHSLELAGERFPSVNADLIFGTPQEGAGAWETSVEGVLAAGIDHLSAYALTVERGTPLARAVAAGAPAPDADDQARAYEAAEALARDAGLVRYETSNFARPGHTCTYNLITWAQGEYAGFGNGAHRHRDGARSWNVRRVDRYVERAAVDPVSGEERPGRWPREVERVMLGLRRAAGVETGSAGRALLASASGKRLVEAGVLGEAAGRLRVLRPLLGDEVGRALLALPEGDC